MEEWIARRINSPHVLKPCPQTRKRNYLYIVTEFVDGQTLSQWMIDNPKPDARNGARIVEQIAQGPAGFPPAGDAASGPAARKHHDRQHRHREDHRFRLDPRGGHGRRWRRPPSAAASLGTVQYTAPEYFLGEAGTPRSDMFSLGVIAYQMLSGRLPYGAEVPKARTRAGAAQIALPLGARRAARDSRRGSIGVLQEGGASRSAPALRGALRVHLRPAPSEQSIDERERAGPGRTQSAGVLAVRLLCPDDRNRNFAVQVELNPVCDGAITIAPARAPNPSPGDAAMLLALC